MGEILDLLWLSVGRFLLLALPIGVIVFEVASFGSYVRALREWRRLGYRYTFLQWTKDFALLLWGISILVFNYVLYYFSYKIEAGIVLNIYMVTFGLAAAAQWKCIGITLQKMKNDG